MNFLKNHGKKVFFILTIIALLIFIGYSMRRPNMTKVESAIGGFFAPGNKFFASLGKGVFDFFDNLTDYFSLDDENEALKVRIKELEEENLRLTEIISESEVLEREAKLLKKTNYTLLQGRIIGKDRGVRHYILTVDIGERDGVKIDQTVISAIKTETSIIKEGLVGRVIDVGDSWAKIETIIDMNNSVSFKLARTLDGGMLKGSENEKLSGYMFDEKSKPGVGDQVSTSGMGGIYPKGLLIGNIEEIEMSEDELSKLVVVEPYVDFMKLSRVYVIGGGE